MSAEIYFFTGSGNSLHVARELQKIPHTKLIPIVSLLAESSITTKAETIGFVYPVYMTAIPLPVKEVITKLNVSSAKYIFAVATRAGTQQSTFHDINKILKKSGRKLDSSFTINMPSNDPKFKFKPLNKSEMKTIEESIKNKIEVIRKTISNKETYLEKDTTYTMRVPFVNAFSNIVPIFAKIQPRFYADSKCEGCGMCRKVCLAGKIEINNKKPAWKDNIKCFNCYACINFCPKKAIQIKGYTEKNDRYSHPYATANDIIKQKEPLFK